MNQFKETTCSLGTGIGNKVSFEDFTTTDTENLRKNFSGVLEVIHRTDMDVRLQSNKVLTQVRVFKENGRLGAVLALTDPTDIEKIKIGLKMADLIDKNYSEHESTVMSIFSQHERQMVERTSSLPRETMDELLARCERNLKYLTKGIFQTLAYQQLTAQEQSTLRAEFLDGHDVSSVVTDKDAMIHAFFDNAWRYVATNSPTNIAYERHLGKNAERIRDLLSRMVGTTRSSNLIAVGETATLLTETFLGVYLGDNSGTPAPKRFTGGMYS